MAPTFIAGLPLWVIELALAGLVYFWNPRKPAHQAFAVVVLTMVGWSFCGTVFRTSIARAMQPPEILWGRLGFAFAGLIGSSFVIFCQVFPDRKSLSLGKGLLCFTLLGAVVAGLCLTPLVLHDVELSGTAHARRHYGPLYPVFSAFMLASFGYGLWTLAQKWRTARGRSRLQLQYLWLGWGIAICGGTTTNLIIPALAHSHRFSAYGPYFSLFFVALTAHAIIRHRLMDIRMVVSQSVTYGLSMLAAAGILWGVFAFAEQGLGSQLSLSSVALVMAILGTVIFHPVRAAIQRFLDRYGYREVYDYRQAIRMVSQALAGLLRIDPLCDQLTSCILTILKVEEVSVYLCPDRAVLARRAYQNANRDGNAKGEPITVISPAVMALLARTETPIVRDELGRWVDSHEVGDIANEFVKLRSEVLLPLFVEDNVAALIAVGEKLSGDPFFTHDIELLAIIGHQAGAALKRAQLYEEVTWMREYSESILRHMESGVIAVTQDGFVTMINEAGARLIGVAPPEVVGTPVTGLIPCGLGFALLDTLTGKTTYTDHEALVIPASGRSHPIVLSTSISHGLAEEPTGAILVFNDVSRIKAFEEEKGRIERLASIGAFMSGITHEIKNPLVAIKTFAELLPEQYHDAEFRETFTKVTLHEVERIDALVRRLRSLAVGPVSQLSPMSVMAPLEETLPLLSGEIARGKIKVVCEPQPLLPPIMGDHDQLKQVFVNLCLNSIEAMAEGGTLTITVRSDSGQQPAELIVQIADTGPGIPAEHLADIFDPFFTLKNQGTGLGLAICRGIMDYHRGSISAANHADGPGAIFTLKLPVIQGEVAYEVAAAGR